VTVTVAPACPARVLPLAGETESQAPPEVVVGAAAQLRVPWPLLETTKRLVVGVEPVAASLKSKEWPTRPMAGLRAGCTWRMRRLPASTMYRLFPDRSARLDAPASQADVAGPPSPEKP